MELEIGKIYNGFKLNRQKMIEEINSVAREFNHEKSGARLLYIQNDDDNKVFTISFRTPPTDSTGLPHILEHSVLCGSRKFPIKDPFVELVKGSLNTFLNAMTYSDKTMYPVASRNEKDFVNLMDVYTDAVFYPNIYNKEVILKQEGWHYDLKDINKDISYKGIVYNEMKGAFSSPEQILFRKIQQSLYPDTPYAYESGGDPEYITDLTYEQFLDFHKKYYHPSNSYIYLYGDGDLLERLKWLDENYLSDFDKIEIDSKIPMQKPFKKPVELIEEYSIANNENDVDKTFLSYNMVTSSAKNNEMYYALEILEYILMESEGAPLKKALIDANIGKDVFGSFDNDILQPSFSIVAKGANLNQKDKFLKVIKQTLRNIAKEGIDKKLIEAAINIHEFKLRESDYGRFPRGLMYGIQSMSSWLYDEDPTLHLSYNETFTILRSGLTTTYFEELITKYLLDNNHASVVIVKPNNQIGEMKDKEVTEKLKKYKNSLTEEQLNLLVKETKELEKYQSEPSPKEELEKIPLLKLEDINKNSEKIELVEKEIEQIKVLYHPDFTNKVSYLNYYFNLKGIDEELLPYVGMLVRILGKVETKNYKYDELSNEINIHTGGIKFGLSVYAKNQDPDEYSPKFVIYTKVFYNKLDNLTLLLNEIVNQSIFSDKKRIKELISEIKSRMEMMLSSSGHIVVAERAKSYFSEAGLFKEKCRGLEFYRFIEKIEKDFDTEYEGLVNKLKEVIRVVINKENLIVSYTAEEKFALDVENSITSFIKGLNEGEKTSHKIDLKPVKKNEAFKSSSKIQYVGKAGNFIKDGYKYKGELSVLQTILSLDYLWNNVRVKGGAYGCMTNFGRNGDMYFTSYRDPSLKRTLKIYDEVYKYVENFDCDDREILKYIIGTISRIDAPLSPSMKGETAISCYFSNITFEDIQKSRDEILSVTKDKINELSDHVKVCMEQDNICVQGNENKIEQNKEIFNNIDNLFN